MKHEALLSSTRVFNGVDGAPRIVAVIPLSRDLSARTIVASLVASLDKTTDDCPEVGLWRTRYVSSAFAELWLP